MKNRFLPYAIGILLCLVYLAGAYFFKMKEREAGQEEALLSEEELQRQQWEKWEEALAARYGAGAEILSEKKEDGEPGTPTLLCSARDGRAESGSFYFTVYHFPSSFGNFYYQLMKTSAKAYWDGLDREYGFYSPEEDEWFSAGSDRWDTRKYPEEADLLWVSCPSWEDISWEEREGCAQDIADWLFFAASDERFFRPLAGEEGARPLFSIGICAQKATFEMELPDFVKEIREGGCTQEQMGRKIAEVMALNGDAAAAWGSPEADAVAWEEWKENFLASYQGDYEKECELANGEIRFRMVVLDAATGSRFYGLLKSMDAGENWQVVSGMPFGEQWGMGIDFTFLNEEFGFATLMHNGGDEAELFVTENGGVSYEPVEMEEVLVRLENGYEYQPYDYPQMPYEQDGRLYVLCGQGADGDYEGGDQAGMALFESTDHGHSFSFIGIKKP